MKGGNNYDIVRSNCRYAYSCKKRKHGASRKIRITHQTLKEIAEILKNEGFIKNVEYIEDDKQGVIRLFLKYGSNNERVITGLKRISKPGLRVYAKANEVPKVLNGLGIALVSTSEGVITDKEARKRNVGGEVLAYIW